MTVVIGTAGHIDHGKTSLLRALTGIDADRLPDEQRRGMTIDVGYAHLALPDGTQLDFVDVPGHDRLVGNMLVGAGEIDAALLVVAADDGPREQTLEHLALLDALRVSPGLVAVTKTDLVDPERAVQVASEVRRLIAGTSLGGSSVLGVSSSTGTGIAELRGALVTLRDQAAATSGGGRHDLEARRTRLAVDRVFGIRGRGAVVTGTLRGGNVARGDVLRLDPGERQVRVRGVQVHGGAVESAGPGRTALNLAGIETGELRRGMMLSGTPVGVVGARGVVTTDRLLVALHRAMGITTWPPPDRTRVRLHIGTDQVEAVVGRGGRDALDLPDGRAIAVLRLASPIAAAIGDRLVLRRPSPGSLVAGGTVLDPRPARGVSRRRQTGERVALLAAAVDGARDDGEIPSARLLLHGAVAPVEGAAPILAPDLVASLRAAAREGVATDTAAHPGEAGQPIAAARQTLARLLRRAASLGPETALAAVSALLDTCVAGGELTRDGDRLRLPGRAAPTRDPALGAAMDRLVAALTMPAPPPLSEAARVTGCPPAGIRALERDGRITLLGPNLAYAFETYRDLAARALSMAAQRPLTPADLRDATGTSRKYVMAILEDLDRRGILRRTDDGHVPGPRAPRRA